MPIYSIVLANSQVTMSSHLLWHFTVHVVYIAIHLCKSMWLIFMEANLWMYFIACLYLYCGWRSRY